VGCFGQQFSEGRTQIVPVQREMERRRFPLVSNPPGSGGDFQGIRVYRSDGLFEERESGRACKTELVSAK
jgi:hypothetical protein